MVSINRVISANRAPKRLEHELGEERRIAQQTVKRAGGTMTSRKTRFGEAFGRIMAPPIRQSVVCTQVSPGATR